MANHPAQNSATPHDRGDAFPRRTMRVSEAQRSLGLGKTTIHKLLKTGQLKSVKIGGARRIPVEAIEALLETSCREEVKP